MAIKKPEPTKRPTVAAKPKNEVAVKKNNLPAEVDFSKMAGAGLEGISAADLIIPRIVILQALSPQLLKKKPEYIEDAQAGMFCDTAVKELWDGEEGIILLPCLYSRIFLEWGPERGDGLIFNHGTNADILAQTEVDENRRNVLPNGNIISPTMTWYCLNLSAGGRRCFVPLTSTQTKAGRQWATAQTAEKLQRKDGSEFTPPIFYRSWHATVVEQSNAKGDWFGWSFAPHKTVLELDPTKQLLADAQRFHKEAASEQVKGDLGNLAEERVEEGDGDAM